MSYVDVLGLQNQSSHVEQEIARLEQRNKDLLNPFKNPLTWLAFNSGLGGREVYQNQIRINELRGMSRECMRQILGEFMSTPEYAIATGLYETFGKPLAQTITSPIRIIAGYDPLTGESVSWGDRGKELLVVAATIGLGLAGRALGAEVSKAFHGIPGRPFAYDLGSTWKTSSRPPGYSKTAPWHTYDYVFRGTTAGFPGGPASQMQRITPVSLQPGVGTAFAYSKRKHGEPILEIATRHDLHGVKVGPGNVMAKIERELSVHLTPAEFSGSSSIVVSANEAAAALSRLNRNIPAYIHRDSLSDWLTNEMKDLTSGEIWGFIVELASQYELR